MVLECQAGRLPKWPVLSSWTMKMPLKPTEPHLEEVYDGRSRARQLAPKSSETDRIARSGPVFA
jgi:hypothetical protein